MTHYTYPISIEKQDAQYYAYSEDLPGVYGYGESLEEAKRSMFTGIRGYIEDCVKDGRPVAIARIIYSETVSLAFD
jgi:predicted RNase H-like HicB family nuclease